MVKSEFERCPICHQLFEDLSRHIWQQTGDKKHIEWMGKKKIKIDADTVMYSRGTLQEIRKALDNSR